MADLVTHVCTALLPGAVIRTRYLPAVVFGTALPDIVGRAVPLGLERLYAAGIPVPMPVLWAWSILHEPVGAALVSVILALLFTEADRWRVLVGLWVGCALHTGLDVLQDHHGEGYLLLAPFSTADFELGWIGSEATVGIAGPLALVTAAAWVPAVIEATWGVPRVRPLALLALMVPVGLVAALAGASVAAWAAAAIVAAIAATASWWPGRAGEYVAVAVSWAGLAALLVSRAGSAIAD